MSFFYYQGGKKCPTMLWYTKGTGLMWRFRNWFQKNPWPFLNKWPFFWPFLYHLIIRQFSDQSAWNFGSMPKIELSDHLIKLISFDQLLPVLSQNDEIWYFLPQKCRLGAVSWRKWKIVWRANPAVYTALQHYPCVVRALHIANIRLKRFD